MSIQLGTAEVNTIRLGNIDVVNNPSTNYRTITVAENILNPLGQRANIKIVDKYDALGSSAFRGSSQFPVVLGFTEFLSRARASFNLRVFEGSDLNDSSEELGGNGRIKTYDIKCVSPEYLKNLDNQLENSYNDFTTNIARDIIQEHLETDKPISIQEPSSTKRIFRFTDSPIEALRVLNDEHVGTQSRSSAFIIFQKQKNGNTEYVISTFETLFRQAPVVTLYRSSRINFSSATREETINSIIRMNVDTAFFSPNRFLTGTYDRTFNLATGVVGDYTTTRSDPFLNEERRPGRRILPTIYDALNETQDITTAEARTLRAYFVSQLSENYGEFTIHGNPNISLGDVVNLNIPNISAEGAGREELFSGRALVVSILHNIVEPGYSPQYTMTLGCVRIT